ncbi:L,D-transpeptidase family protein [Gorillibacterium sp. sgz500922]|uniref:L,D-transpeptidase n=1 Tax=Gorillibacterium sp. sgz500922 TaxID=3446694 RepID=UPI003F680B85
MGWYLLGRQYEESGKAKKAMFCYAKAGEIFEAYEKKKLPATVEEEAMRLDAANAPADDNGAPGGAVPEATDAGEGRAAARTGTGAPSEEELPSTAKSLSRRLRLAAVALLLAAGLLISPGLHAPGREAAAPPGESAEPAPSADSAKPSASPATPGTDSAARRLGGVQFLGKGAAKGEAERAAGSLLLQPPDSGEAALLAEVPVSADGKWLLWTLSPRPLVEAAGSGSGAAEVRYYDRAVCACEADDGADQAAKRASAWLSQELERAVLRSAASAYREAEGKLPPAAEVLAGDYPHNRLSGLTDTMRRYWPVLSARQGTGGENDGGQSGPPANTASPSPPGGSKSPSPAGGGSPSPAVRADSPTPLQQPLEIIVDKRSHRLAVVSGRVLLRNYPVGLGGKRTPEGVFAVSEKVRNPNGRSDGDFGSRGMTLSATDYAIHGTDEPDSIGKDESLGCIRMDREDVEELFDLVPLGTRVTIGAGTLPNEPVRAKSRFRLPAEAQETNPAKIYRWLD